MTQIADYLKARLVDVLKPELLNRFSKIIIFKNLEVGELPKIVQINVSELVDAVKGKGSRWLSVPKLSQRLPGSAMIRSTARDLCAAR